MCTSKFNSHERNKYRLIAANRSRRAWLFSNQFRNAMRVLISKQTHNLVKISARASVSFTSSLEVKRGVSYPKFGIRGGPAVFWTAPRVATALVSGTLCALSRTRPGSRSPGNKIPQMIFLKDRIIGLAAYVTLRV